MRTPQHPPGLPQPTRDRGPLLVLLAGLGAAVAFVVLALTAGGSGGRAAAAPVPPAQLPVAAAIPQAQATPPVAVAQAPAPQRVTRKLDERRFARNDRQHVRADWVAGFYPIYEASAEAHDLNWLLLASIHKQETGFSTHPTTYRGLNFANCCAGPMQFNVTNGPVSTWERFRGAHTKAPRPEAYNHATRKHPSVYDDFDAMMAAGALLKTAGAGRALDASAWRAAYDYYGHDLTGVDYATRVVARAIGWGRSRFCINCETDPAIIAAVDAAWAAPVRAEYAAAERARKNAPRALAARKQR